MVWRGRTLLQIGKVSSTPVSCTMDEVLERTNGIDELYKAIGSLGAARRSCGTTIKRETQKTRQDDRRRNECALDSQLTTGTPSALVASDALELDLELELKLKLKLLIISLGWATTLSTPIPPNDPPGVTTPAALSLCSPVPASTSWCGSRLLLVPSTCRQEEQRCSTKSKRTNKQTQEQEKVNYLMERMARRVAQESAGGESEVPVPLTQQRVEGSTTCLIEINPRGLPLKVYIYDDIFLQPPVHVDLFRLKKTNSTYEVHV